MEQSVVIFEPDTPTFTLLADKLVKKGIKVIRVTGISELHDTLYSTYIQAILVPSAIMQLYCIQMDMHLEQAQSRKVILAYDLDAFGTIAVQQSDTAGSTAVVSALARLTQSALTETAAAETLAETGCVYNAGSAGILREELYQNLHRKAAELLRAIDRSGAAGLSPEQLADRLWPENGRNRRDDIQAYISHLRHHLKDFGQARFSIRYQNKKYRIVPE